MVKYLYWSFSEKIIDVIVLIGLSNVTLSDAEMEIFRDNSVKFVLSFLTKIRHDKD